MEDVTKKIIVVRFMLGVKIWSFPGIQGFNTWDDLASSATVSWWRCLFNFVRFLVPMRLTFLRNHPYHYLGKKARPELPNEVKTTQCVAAPQERAQRAATQELGSHICVIWASNWPQFFHREMWRVLSYIMERHSRDSCKFCLHFFGMPVTLDNLAIFPAQVSGCLRLQLQFDYNGSLEGREISTRRLHITRGRVWFLVARLRFCCCQWHLQRGLAGNVFLLDFKSGLHRNMTTEILKHQKI